MQSLCILAQSAPVLCTHLQALTATFSNLIAVCKHICLSSNTAHSAAQAPAHAVWELCVLLAAVS